MKWDMSFSQMLPFILNQVISWMAAAGTVSSNLLGELQVNELVSMRA